MGERRGRRAGAAALIGAYLLLKAADPPGANAEPTVVGARAVALSEAGAMAVPAGLRVSRFSKHLTRAPYLTDRVGRHVAVNFATDRSRRRAHVRYGRVVRGHCRLRSSAPAARVAITVGRRHEYQWTSRLTLRSARTYCYRPYMGPAGIFSGATSPRRSPRSSPRAAARRSPSTSSVTGVRSTALDATRGRRR